MPQTVVVDFNVDDTRDSLRALMVRLAAAWEEGSGTDTIDLSKCRYLGPNAAALLWAIELVRRHSARPMRIILPKRPPALRAFCAFSGLSHFLTGAPLPDAEHPDCETSVLEQFFVPRANQSDPLIRLIRRHSEMSREDEESLRVCFAEVAQNIHDHASSPIGGVWCARYFAGTREARVAIVDAGVGVHTTLARKYPEAAVPSEALSRVLVGEYTSRSRASNMGLGISNLALIVRRMEGTLLLATGDAIARVRSGREGAEITHGGFFFPGTGVFFVLQLSE